MVAEQMIPIVAKVLLKCGFEFVSYKFRSYKEDHAVNSVKRMTEKFREYIVHELNEINSKLDGLCRMGRSASISFLKQGVLRLLMHVFR